MGLFNIYPLTSFHTILVLVFLLPLRAKDVFFPLPPTLTCFMMHSVEIATSKNLLTQIFHHPPPSVRY